MSSKTTRKPDKKTPPKRGARRKAPTAPNGLELLLTIGGELTSVITSDDVASGLIVAYTDRVLGHHLAERMVHLKGLAGGDTHTVQTSLVFPLGLLSKVQLRDLIRHGRTLRTALKRHSGLSIFSNAEEIGFHRITPLKGEEDNP